MHLKHTKSLYLTADKLQTTSAEIHKKYNLCRNSIKAHFIILNVFEHKYILLYNWIKA